MVTPAPKPFMPTCWPRILAVATRCVARRSGPAAAAVVRAGERQRRVDVAAQVEARTHGAAR